VPPPQEIWIARSQTSGTDQEPRVEIDALAMRFAILVIALVGISAVGVQAKSVGGYTNAQAARGASVYTQYCAVFRADFLIEPMRSGPGSVVFGLYIRRTLGHPSLFLTVRNDTDRSMSFR
jgi:hypothetical protein